MIVSIEELHFVLRLSKNDCLSPPTPLGYHFYIRSWTFSIDELMNIIQYLEEADLAFEELDEWRKTITLYRANPSTVSWKNMTIRYLGTVQGPKRPIDRYVEDLTQRRSGVLHEFLQAVDYLYPAAENGHVELIEDASLETYVSPTMRDDMERVLIEYFGHPTLLNRQDGGFYTSYLPTDDMAELWRVQDVQFYNHFTEDAYATPPTMRTGLVQHFAELQQSANQNSWETGTVRHYFTDRLRDVMIEQAMPYQYKKAIVPIVIVGKDITLKDYLAETSFWTGKGQASALVVDFLRRIVREEARANGIERGWNDESFDFNVFPFVDLWCWLWHKRLSDAVGFLRRYFQIVRPLIAVSFSLPVNDIVMADFDEDGVGILSMIDVVGIPTLQFYDSEDGQGCEDSAFINVPHIHPGRDKYSSKNIELRNVMDFSLEAGLLTRPAGA